MEDGHSWIRQIASMLAIVLVGGVLLGLVGWLAMSVVPESDGLDLGDASDASAATLPPTVDVAELAPADGDDASVDIDTCEVVDDIVQVTGSLRNTSGLDQAFVVHVAVLFDGELFDGLPADIGVPTVDDGGEAAWGQAVGSVDPDDEAQHDPECELDRIGVGEELTG